MTMTSQWRAFSSGRWAVLCTGVLALAGTASAQSPGQGTRSGGLLPTREPSSASGGMSREELMRRFDLDANGTIDQGEAEAARVRIRRDRLEALRSPGLDPLTGRPRDAAAPDGRAAPQDDDLLLIPGKPEDAPRPNAAKPVPDDEGKPPTRPPAAVPPGRMPAITGGVRAGAPAVRPGYGATGPKPDLNAGRPREARPSAAGTPARGTMPGSMRQPPATTPRPSTFPQRPARISAEDFGR